MQKFLLIEYLKGARSLSKSGIPRKILDIYSGHIAEQEAEIQALNKTVAEYTKKFGELDLSGSAEVQKATVERELQEMRKKNTSIRLQLETLQNSLTQRTRTVKEMEEAIETLTKKASGESGSSLKKLEDNVKSLEKKSEDYDIEITKLEKELNGLLQVHREML